MHTSMNTVYVCIIHVCMLRCQQRATAQQRQPGVSLTTTKTDEAGDHDTIQRAEGRLSNWLKLFSNFVLCVRSRAPSRIPFKSPVFTDVRHKASSKETVSNAWKGRDFRA